MIARKTTIIRNSERGIQKYRFIAQLFFSLVSIWIGVEFYLFINHLESGAAGSYYRPPGVEAYLPISSLMSIVYFLRTGIVHPVHPAGFFMLIGFIAVSFTAGKSFCSWICPVGLISEYIGEFGAKIFKKSLKLPAILDYPLRGIKYLLLFFFVNSILAMTAIELRMFLDSDYNKIADIKLYDFFGGMSGFSIIVISGLFLLSIVYRGFWCRYLCPYGAFFGIIGIISPAKITRDSNKCIDCGKCDKACPSHIKVMKNRFVVSDECTSCMNCIDACPVKDTLYYSVPVINRKISKNRLMLIAGLIYVIIVFSAILTGSWGNKISTEDYGKIYRDKTSISHQ